jgi:ribosomal protein S18 acetylase RimI-like enzyme
VRDIHHRPHGDLPQPELTHKPESPEDEPFLRRLIGETTTEEFGAWAWPEPLRRSILATQYIGRRRSHTEHFPQAESRLIQSQGEDCGWIVTAKLPDEIRIVDIVVAAPFRNRGIGGAAIRAVQTEAETEGIPVRLNVNATNTAGIRLYERLGFRRIGGDEIRNLMEYVPAVR